MLLKFLLSVFLSTFVSQISEIRLTESIKMKIYSLYIGQSVTFYDNIVILPQCWRKMWNDIAFSVEMQTGNGLNSYFSLCKLISTGCYTYICLFSLLILVQVRCICVLMSKSSQISLYSSRLLALTQPTHTQFIKCYVLIETWSSFNSHFFVLIVGNFSWHYYVRIFMQFN